VASGESDIFKFEELPELGPTPEAPGGDSLPADAPQGEVADEMSLAEAPSGAAAEVGGAAPGEADLSAAAGPDEAAQPATETGPGLGDAALAGLAGAAVGAMAAGATGEAEAGPSLSFLEQTEETKTPAEDELPEEEKEQRPGILQRLAEASPYTVMLGVTIAALFLACLFFLFELWRYEFDISAKTGRQNAAAAPLEPGASLKLHA
jgi:hypothetical protein